jgi:hypothetical protein
LDFEVKSRSDSFIWRFYFSFIVSPFWGDFFNIIVLNRSLIEKKQHSLLSKGKKIQTSKQTNKQLECGSKVAVLILDKLSTMQVRYNTLTLFLLQYLGLGSSAQCKNRKIHTF